MALPVSMKYSQSEISVGDFGTIQEACDKDYRYLDMKHYSMVAQVESVTCLNNATVLLYTISHHRPDKFVYHDFARRDQKV